MAKRNALMEWIDQTKKLAKSKDYRCLDLIDRIFECLFTIDPQVLTKHKELFDDVCNRYHKPNPLHYLSSKKKVETVFREQYGKGIQETIRARLRDQFMGRIPNRCVAQVDWRSCAISKFGTESISKFVDAALIRAEAAQKDILWQWFEVIDFMFERPELVNLDLIDEYVSERIRSVCTQFRKNNPLNNGMRKRFGKYWKDEKGHWRRERRRRF